MSDFGDDLGEIIDLLINTIDLFKNIPCFWRRKITPALSLEDGMAIKEVYSDDDNLEAVFKYLVSK